MVTLGFERAWFCVLEELGGSEWVSVSRLVE